MRIDFTQRWLATMAAASLAIAVGGCTSATGERQPELWSVRVIAEFPHDRDAFTQGLAMQDGILYEGTGRYGSSYLRRVDLSTGNVEQFNRLPYEYFGEGIAIVDDRIFQLTWKSGTAIVYDKTSFRILQTHDYTGEGWGLTYDGEHLIMSDGTSRLRFLDPASFELVREVSVHADDEIVDDINELEMVDGEVWANIWYEDRIARISPADGSILGWIDVSGVYPSALRDLEDVANGIAHDASTGKLYMTGKLWPRLYEIEIVER